MKWGEVEVGWWQAGQAGQAGQGRQASSKRLRPFESRRNCEGTDPDVKGRKTGPWSMPMELEPKCQLLATRGEGTRPIDRWGESSSGRRSGVEAPSTPAHQSR
jgi:hypothetical protein